MGAVKTGGANAEGFSMRLLGLDDLQRKLEDLHNEDLDEEMEAAAQEVLGSVMAQSQAIVPYDTGALHDSAYVSVVRQRRGLQAHIGYDTPYAIYVHENPDAYHAAPTRWKFLEEPFAMAQPRITKRIGQAVKEHIRAVAR